MIFTISRKSESDYMVDTHIIVWGFGEKQWKITSLKKGFYSEKYSSSDGKVIFHQRVNKSMKSTFDKCVLNFTPVTNPTHYTKFDKSTKNRETNQDWFELGNT